MKGILFEKLALVIRFLENEGITVENVELVWESEKELDVELLINIRPSEEDKDVS